MNFNINSEYGEIYFAPFHLSWGNELHDLRIPGYFSIGIGQVFLEMGDIDQGRDGIYLTRFVDGEPVRLLSIWQA